MKIRLFVLNENRPSYLEKSSRPVGKSTPTELQWQRMEDSLGDIGSQIITGFVSVY